jgi:hypothetical protein
MNTKTLLATLAGGIASFFLGWLVFGILMDPMYKEHMMTYEGLMKDTDPPAVSSMIAIFVANLAWSLAIALICSWSNMVGFMKGAVIGATIGFLMGLQFDMFNLAFMNMYKDTMIIVVDLIVGTIFSAIIGGIIGWVMGMGKKTAAPAM